MEQPRLIGFCGRAGAGKDTIAAELYHLLSARHSDCYFLSFAQPLRDMLAALGVPEEYMERRDLKNRPVPGFGASFRTMAQTLGTEWGRGCVGKDFWVQQADRRLRDLPGVVLVTDVRFPEEAAWLRSKGGVLVRVERPEADCAFINHESEAHAGAMPADHVVDNSGPRSEAPHLAMALALDLNLIDH